MQNKAHALAAGLFVVVVTALLVLLAMWLLRDSANTRPYEMISTEAVTGLQEQAVVRYKGVAVGKVTQIGFDPDQRSNVLVRMAIDESAPISGATYATLALQGITGLSFVQLDDAGEPMGDVADGPHDVPRIPLRQGALGELGDRAGDLLLKVDKTVEALNAVLGPDNQSALAETLASLRETAVNINRLSKTADEVLSRQFDPDRMDMPALVQQATETMNKLGEATNDVRAAVAEINGVVTEARSGLQQVTGEGGLIDRLDEGSSTVLQTTLPRIQGLTRDASSTIRRLDRLTNTLSENPQVLLFGQGEIPPGPGEDGFEAPVPQPDGSVPLTGPR